MNKKILINIVIMKYKKKIYKLFYNKLITINKKILHNSNNKLMNKQIILMNY